MKRADVILGAAVLMICAVWICAGVFWGRQGAYALVRLDGQIYGSYALDKDQEIDIGEGNHISIQNGAVRMTDADCPDLVCVHQGKISRVGAMITCLPNRVTVQVLSDEQTGEDAPDAIAY